MKSLELKFNFNTVEELQTFLDKVGRDQLESECIPNLSVKDRRQKILTVLPLGLVKVRDDKIIEEVPGTPRWLQNTLGLKKDQVRKDLDYLQKKGIKRVPVKLRKEGLPFKVNTYIYFKDVQPKVRENVFFKYVEEFRTEDQVLKIVDVIINLLPHKDPIMHNLKKEGKQNILREVNWKLGTTYTKDLIYSLVDTLVSIKLIERVRQDSFITKKGSKYFVFYNNPSFNRSIYSRKDMIEYLKEEMGKNENKSNP